MSATVRGDETLVQEGDEFLPEDDVAYLRAKGYSYKAVREGNQVLLILFAFGMPAAYTPRTCDLLVILPAGYPGGSPDMFWTKPHITLVRGGDPLTANVVEARLGETWQRWSRHSTAAWRSGIDGIETFLGSVRSELARGL